VRIAGSGHQGLPQRTAELVDAALREVLGQHAGGMVGVTFLAGGADQLFARAVLDLGGALEVIVPAEQYRDGLSVEAQPGYDELIGKAARVERLPLIESTEEAHMAAGRVLVDGADMVVAVWDGKPARGLGGTADVVAYARERDVPVKVVWPPGATRD
jgi:hypothetical protein